VRPLGTRLAAASIAPHIGLADARRRCRVTNHVSAVSRPRPHSVSRPAGASQLEPGDPFAAGHRLAHLRRRATSRLPSSAIPASGALDDLAAGETEMQRRALERVERARRPPPRCDGRRAFRVEERRERGAAPRAESAGPPARSAPRPVSSSREVGVSRSLSGRVGGAAPERFMPISEAGRLPLGPELGQHTGRALRCSQDERRWASSGRAARAEAARAHSTAAMPPARLSTG